MNSTVLGHPKGLVTLFITESCERFSYYGMRAILVLYLIDHFMFKESVAFEIVASYGAMVYFMPIIGGFVADRYLGFRKAVIFGAVLLCVGHLLMAFEGDPAQVVDGVVQRDEMALTTAYLAMSFIIVGVGFLKACISNMVGQLYTDDESRRDQGFTIFYFGINLGAMSAILLCAYLGQTYGWGYGFGLAGIVMLVGLTVFLTARSTLEGIGEPRKPELLKQRILLIPLEWYIYAGGVLATLITAYLLETRDLTRVLLYGVGSVALVGIVVYALVKCTTAQFLRLCVILYLIVVSVFFWGLFEQAAHSLKGFASRNLDPELWFITFNPGQIEALNPAFILILSPIFVGIWAMLSSRRIEPSHPMKFGIGTVLCGLGFSMFLLGCLSANADHQVAMIWVALGFLLITMGELCLSPVGLSMVTRYSPIEVVGVMMGIWFLASSVGSLFGGWLAQFAAIDTVPGQVVPAADSLAVYTDAFRQFTLIGVVIGGFVILSAFGLSRLNLFQDDPSDEDEAEASHDINPDTNQS